MAAAALDLPAGLDPSRSAALTALVAEVTGTSLPDDPLPLAPALLLSDPAVAARLSLPAVAPGAVLVHDYQGLDLAPPFPCSAPLSVAASEQAEGAAREFVFRIARPGGSALAELRTGLRLLPAAELAGAQGMRMRPLGVGAETWRQGVTVSDDAVARYCEVSGDDNPLHRPGPHLTETGLPAPVVPGMLLLSLFQPGCSALLPAEPVTALKARFMAPVFIGRETGLALMLRGPAPVGGTRARGFVLLPDGSAAAIVDLVLGGAPQL